MSNREALLVGSMPFENEEEAMRLALDQLGGALWALPDGEIGEKSEKFPRGTRSAWVQVAIDLCANDPDNWHMVRDAKRNADGFPVDYVSGERLTPKHPPKEMDKHLNLHYHDYFFSSYPIFKRLREEKGLPNLKMQVGIPTGLGICFAMLSPINALRYAAAFNRRLAWEVNEILKVGGDDVIFQIEIPAELALAHRAPAFMGWLPVNSMMTLIKNIDPAAKLGIHMCFGDLNNQALTQAKTLEKAVAFTNRMVKAWPSTHSLLYVHFPLAEAAEPPTMDAAYYAPLKDIQLPNGVKFVAGFIHEKRTLEEHLQILKTIEELRGKQVAVACSCGMGRRPREVGEQLLQITHQIVDA